MKTLLNEASAEFVGELDKGAARDLARELELIPQLEGFSGASVEISGLPSGYRAITLPSRHLVVYRWLSDDEKKSIKSLDSPSDQAMLVAAIEPVALVATGPTGPALVGS